MSSSIKIFVSFSLSGMPENKLCVAKHSDDYKHLKFNIAFLKRLISYVSTHLSDLLNVGFEM